MKVELSPFDREFAVFNGSSLDLGEDIAVIGSSGRLRDNPLGAEIDEHEHIVRFNRAPMAGWEDMVGSRETVRCMNNGVWQCREFSRGGFTQTNTDFAKSVKDQIAICYGFKKAFDAGLKNIDESNRIGRLRVENTNKLKAAAGYKGPGELTIGLFFILTCVNAGVVPHLYGFDIERDRIRDHYWEERSPNSPYHKPNIEKLFFRKLHKVGSVIIHE